MHRITLNAVYVVTNSACSAQTESPSADARAAWAEVRTALEASSLTRDQRMVATSAFRFERKLRPDATVLSVDTTQRGRAGERPFKAIEPATLEQKGYVVQYDDEALDFYGPDETVLLSDGFTRMHCVSTSPAVRHDSTGTQIALTFIPRDRTTRADIRGSVWIDSATSELRAIDFQYVRVQQAERSDSLGGSVAFTRSASGGWIVSSWQLRILRFTTRLRPPGRLVRARDGFLEVGGAASMIDAATAAADSLAHLQLAAAEVLPHPMRTGRILGVFDDATGQPVVGAEVVELATMTKGVTSDAGMVSLAWLSSGANALQVRKVGYRTRFLTLSPADTASLTVVLASNAQTLPKVVTTGESITARRMAEFEERRHIGIGHFLTRADLAKFEGQLTENAVRTMPGVHISHGGTYRDAFVGALRGGVTANGSCKAAVVVDGIVVYRGPPQAPVSIDSYNPEDIEGIEFYAGDATIPMKFGVTTSTCGLVVIWTRQ